MRERAIVPSCFRVYISEWNTIFSSPILLSLTLQLSHSLDFLSLLSEGERRFLPLSLSPRSPRQRTVNVERKMNGRGRKSHLLPPPSLTLPFLLPSFHSFLTVSLPSLTLPFLLPSFHSVLTVSIFIPRRESYIRVSSHSPPVTSMRTIPLF